MTIEERKKLYEQKHCIQEQVEPIVEVTPEIVPQVNEKEIAEPNQGIATGVINTLSALLKDEWEAIDQYNNAIVMLQTLTDTEPLVAILQEVLADEYNHIGALEKALTLVAPEAEQIADGKEEAEQQIGDKE